MYLFSKIFVTTDWKLDCYYLSKMVVIRLQVQFFRLKIECNIVVVSKFAIMKAIVKVLLATLAGVLNFIVAIKPSSIE